jgi:uncharacterized flavoprotein (TIGR03862 family)
MTPIAIIGAGPAGLIAAEHLARQGRAVTIYDQMPTPGRKFLLAGRGGLNLTHSEAEPAFLAHYHEAAPFMASALQAFPPAALRAWCEGLGQPTFVGSSGRVFPQAFKAAPLLRAWLRRLDSLGVRFAPRHRFVAWTSTGAGAGQGALRFETPAGETPAGETPAGETPAGETEVDAAAVLLAMGGASWPRLGSDGAWADVLRARGVRVGELRPSNCGVLIDWSPVFLGRFEGAPLKRVALSAGGDRFRGEAVVTRSGLEGGAVYALSHAMRRALDAHGTATLHIDLRPDIDPPALAARVDGPRQGVSLSNHLRQRAGLPPVGVGLVQEALHAGAPPALLSRLIKALPIPVRGVQPIGRAISSAGGIALEELDSALMLHRMPGVFAAGEMLDWDAPTGGYLLQACFSTGIAAARGIAAWVGPGKKP